MPSHVVDTLVRAIKEAHRLDGRLRNTTRIRHESHGRLVWEGDVYTFDLEPFGGCVCYAWISSWATSCVAPVAMLGDDPIASPGAAVRTWIARQAKLQAHQMKR
jgi:hypothetical protein